MLALALVAIAAAAYSAWLAHQIWKEGRESARDFARKFPGRCAVCSFHRHGVEHGFVAAEDLPTHHTCIEARHG